MHEFFQLQFYPFRETEFYTVSTLDRYIFTDRRQTDIPSSKLVCMCVCVRVCMFVCVRVCVSVCVWLYVWRYVILAREESLQSRGNCSLCPHPVPALISNMSAHQDRWLKRKHFLRRQCACGPWALKRTGAEIGG